MNALIESGIAVTSILLAAGFGAVGGFFCAKYLHAVEAQRFRNLTRYVKSLGKTVGTDGAASG